MLRAMLGWMNRVAKVSLSCCKMNAGLVCIVASLEGSIAVGLSFWLALLSIGAQMVTGSFSLAGVAYTNTLVASGSPLALRLGAALEEALARFGLPGLQEAAITAVSNR